jgi:hypothetical protein
MIRGSPRFLEKMENSKKKTKIAGFATARKPDGMGR